MSENGEAIQANAPLPRAKHSGAIQRVKSAWPPEVRIERAGQPREPRRIGGPSFALGVAVFASVWLLVALPFVTDAACFFLVAFFLGITWLLLAVLWLLVSLAQPASLRSARGLVLWLYALCIGLTGLGLAFTDHGLRMRVFLCQRSLTAYASAIPPGTRQNHSPDRLVGLFLVQETEASNGAVVLYTSADFLDRYGLVYLPPGAAWPSGVRYRSHLFGPWYSFWWHF
jgi:hypothetical protein